MIAPSLFDAPTEPAGVQLYDFQSLSVEDLRVNIRNRVASQILSAPTGSGKTEVAMYLIEQCYERGQRALFICDRLSLIGQTSRRMDLYGIPHGIIQGKNERTDRDARIQIASVQTLKHRRIPNAELYIIDECHTMYETVRKLIADLRDCGRRVTIIGLTATPFSKGLGQHYDAVVSVTTTEKLIEQGFLAPYRVFNASQADMTGAKSKAGEWTLDEAGSRSMAVVGDAVREYLKWCPGQKFIAFGARIADCEQIQRRFMDAGIMCALYTADTGDEEREELNRQLNDPNGHLMGLISVSALAKGYDAPVVSCVIDLRPLKSSLAEHIQKIGRGMRRDPADPSKICTILDHSGNWERFWPDVDHFFRFGAHELDDGKKKPKSEKRKAEREQVKCPKCSVFHMPRPACSNCGHVYPKRAATVRELPGELRAWTGASAIAQPADVLRSLAAQLMYVATERGYKPGWILHKFKEMTGGETLPYVEQPEPPTVALSNRLRYLAIRYAKGREKANKRKPVRT